MAFAGLESGRIGVAAQAVGIARAALARRCVMRGSGWHSASPSSSTRAIAFQLAEAATEVEAATQLTMSAARLKNAGVALLQGGIHGQAVRDTDGGAGLLHGDAGAWRLRLHRGFPVEKLYRDARILQVYDGTNEVQKMLIARALSDDA